MQVTPLSAVSAHLTFPLEFRSQVLPGVAATAAAALCPALHVRGAQEALLQLQGFSAGRPGFLEDGSTLSKLFSPVLSNMNVSSGSRPTRAQ